MFMLSDISEGSGVDFPIIADNDNKDDLLHAIRYADNKGLNAVGSLQLIHGTDKIPVHISGVVNTSITQSEALFLRSSVIDRATAVELTTDQSEPLQIVFRDILGREVYRTSRESIGGTEEFRLLLPQLSNGRYQLEILTPYTRLSSSVLIIH
jgi:hypothetical protein